MKIHFVSNVSKIVAGCLLACGLIVSPALAKGGHGGGGHGGGGHHGGGHHEGGHHTAHHPAEHHPEHRQSAHKGPEHHPGEHHPGEHHPDRRPEHPGDHRADHRDDHRGDRRDDHHVHYHNDHHHYYYGGGWGWLPDVWGWPGYVGPDYSNSAVNYNTVNNTGDDTVETSTDVSQTDLPASTDTDEQDLPPLDNRGIIRVKLPTPRAIVTFDGHKILGTRPRRMIVTSPIEGDSPVKFQVHATWNQDGEQRHEVREGFISAGGNVLADFTKPAAEEATFTQAPAE